MLSTSLDELPAWHQSGSSVEADRVVRSLGAAAQGSPESHHVWLDPGVPTTATFGRRYRPADYTRKWNISRIAWVISCRHMTRRTRKATTSAWARRLSFGN
jgi:hypothetical protein